MGESSSMLRWIGWLAACYGGVVATVKPLEGLLAALLLLFSCVLLWREKKIDESVRRYGLIVGLYFLVPVISVALQGNLSETVVYGVKTSTIFLVIFLAIYLRDSRPINLALTCFCFALLVIALITLFQGVWLGMRDPRPPTMISAVHAGYLLSYAFLIISVYALHSRQQLRLIAVINVCLLGSALLINATRGAWAATAVAMTTLMLATTKKSVYLLVLLAVFPLLLLLPQVKSRCFDDYHAITRYSYGSPVETSLGSKLDMWLASIEMFKKSPLFGVGPGNWQQEMQVMIEQKRASQVLTRFNQPHNMYLNALATTGMVGLAALVLFSAFPVYFAWSSGLGRSFYTDALFVVSIAFVLQGQTDSVTQMYRPFQSYLFLVGVCMAGMLASKREPVT